MPSLALSQNPISLIKYLQQSSMPYAYTFPEMGNSPPPKPTYSFCKQLWLL